MNLYNYIKTVFNFRSTNLVYSIQFHLKHQYCMRLSAYHKITFELNWFKLANVQRTYFRNGHLVQ